MTPAIETLNLTRRYGRTLALDSLNLTVQQGSIYGFIGPNGAGKTTTLRLLAGMLTPSSGEVRLLGQTQQVGNSQRLIGYMPDVSGLYQDLRVWEYLDFFARCYRLDAAKRKRTVDDLLDIVGLGQKREAFVQHLSRGMQQRLALAHTLVHNPPVLLLDEPASGLDPRARVELRELLRTLREMGKTILLSSHILSELAEVCNEIGIIESGRMVISGPMDVVRQQLQGGTKLRIRVLGDATSTEWALRRLMRTGKIENAYEAIDERLAGLPTILTLSADLNDPRAFIAEVETQDEDQQAALLTYLLASGVTVSEFRTQAENLEELFLRLTTA